MASGLHVMVIVFTALAPFILHCDLVFALPGAADGMRRTPTALAVGPGGRTPCAPLGRTRSEGLSLLGTRAYLCNDDNILPVVK